MGIFTKIEIHFVEGEGEEAEERRVVIRPRDGVQAILLPGFQSRIALEQGEPRQIDRPPGKSIVEGEIKPGQKGGDFGRGPGRVCYLEDGVVRCWNPN